MNNKETKPEQISLSQIFTDKLRDLLRLEEVKTEPMIYFVDMKESSKDAELVKGVQQIEDSINTGKSGAMYIAIEGLAMSRLQSIRDYLSIRKIDLLTTEDELTQWIHKEVTREDS